MSKQPLYGISSALYGENPRRMTTSVLSGTEKNDIRIIGSFNHRIAEDADTIGTAVRNLIQVTNGALQANTITDAPYPVPVVYGSPENIEVADLLPQLAATYPGMIPDRHLGLPNAMKEPGIRQIYDAMFGTPPSDREIALNIFGVGIEDILRRETGNNKFLQFEPRLFMPADEESNISTIERSVLLKTIPGRLQQNVRDLVQDVLDGETDTKPKLDEAVRELARMYAAVQMIRNEGKTTDARFMAVASPPDTSEHGDIRNIIYSNFDLRQVFGEAFMKAIDINYNLCLKCQLDPKSPPFADVCATYIADLMDKRDGTKPGVVMVKHRV